MQRHLEVASMRSRLLPGMSNGPMSTSALASPVRIRFFRAELTFCLSKNTALLYSVSLNSIGKFWGGGSDRVTLLCRLASVNLNGQEVYIFVFCHPQEGQT
jgi:hypothetical protein